MRGAINWLIDWVPHPSKPTWTTDHLIAAAPAMYEALLKCQAVIMASQYRPGPGEPPVLRDGVVDKALRMACAALAAARGETR